MTAARRFALLMISLLMLFPATATAQKLGALQVDVRGDVEDPIRDAVRTALARAGSSGKWSWVDEATTRRAMTDVSRDCFTTSCLVEAGKQTAIDGGVRVRLSGQAEIFDWTIDVYDLHAGTLAASQKGACELCGIVEVRAAFESDARAAVAAAKITTPKPKVATKPKTPSEPTSPATSPSPRELEVPKPESEPVVPRTSDDPTVDLVMVNIIATPDDTAISIGDQPIGQGEVTVSLEHGTYDITFAREGYRGLRETLVIGPQTSQKAMLRVHLAKTDPDAVFVENEGPVDRLGQQRKLYGILGLAGGGVLLTTGIVLSAMDGKPTCNDPGGNCPRLYETSAAAFTTTLVGSVLATGGAVLLAWDVLSGRSESQPRATRIVPFVGPDAAGLGVVGRF